MSPTSFQSADYQSARGPLGQVQEVRPRVAHFVQVKAGGHAWLTVRT